jgi:hypothetical protein
MNATEIGDRILDWDIGYWGGGYHGVEFVCSYPQELTRPDRRCKTGIRTWHEYCHHQFRQWSTIRDLIKAVQEHVQEVHPECENLH